MRAIVTIRYDMIGSVTQRDREIGLVVEKWITRMMLQE